MPACGQAVGCGVCDMPELWRGAAGLCARVRACAVCWCRRIVTCIIYREDEDVSCNIVCIYIYIIYSIIIIKTRRERKKKATEMAAGAPGDRV